MFRELRDEGAYKASLKQCRQDKKVARREMETTETRANALKKNHDELVKTRNAKRRTLANLKKSNFVHYECIIIDAKYPWRNAVATHKTDKSKACQIAYNSNPAYKKYFKKDGRKRAVAYAVYKGLK